MDDEPQVDEEPPRRLRSSDGNASPTLDDLRDRIRAFAEVRDWVPFHTPKNLVMATAGEVGELVAVLQWLTAEESEALVEPEHPLRPELEDELADVLIYLTRLADVTGVDLIAAALAKMDRNETRFPPER